MRARRRSRFVFVPVTIVGLVLAALVALPGVADEDETVDAAAPDTAEPAAVEAPTTPEEREARLATLEALRVKLVRRIAKHREDLDDARGALRSAERVPPVAQRSLADAHALQQPTERAIVARRAAIMQAEWELAMSHKKVGRILAGIAELDEGIAALRARLEALDAERAALLDR